MVVAVKKLGIPSEVLACRSFDEVLAKNLFGNLPEAQQIAIYNYFILQEKEQEKAIPYSDLEDCTRDISIDVEGDSTSVQELLSEGYYIRQCKEKGRSFRGIAAWRDEVDWKYLRIVYVKPEFRRRGIVGGLIEDGYDGKPISIKIHMGNSPAIKAAEKYGFTTQQRTGDYFHLIRE